MKADTLAHHITELIKYTKAGRIKWNVEMDTTEFKPEEEKPHIQENRKEWIVDECFTSFACSYQNEDFCVITYEVIKKSGDIVKSNNLVFMPPAFQRIFDLNLLVNYSVETNYNLMMAVHNLWTLLLDMKKAEHPNVVMNVTGGEVMQPEA